jgi:hypothetical protein
LQGIAQHLVEAAGGGKREGAKRHRQKDMLMYLLFKATQRFVYGCGHLVPIPTGCEPGPVTKRVC